LSCICPFPCLFAHFLFMSQPKNLPFCNYHCII
jgi:hypothetical protein